MEEEIKDEVQGQPQDESPDEPESKDEESQTQEDENQTEESDETEESSEEPDSEEEFVKAFEDIEGDTPEEYMRNLEEKYKNSSEEGRRLSGENKKLKKENEDYVKRYATGEMFGRELRSTDENTDTDDYVRTYVSQEMGRQATQDYTEFKHHSELESDPALKKNVMSKGAAYAQAIFETEGRIAGMGEVLRVGYAAVKGDDVSEVSQDPKQVAAAPSTTPKPQKAETKPRFSDAQLQVTMKMRGISRAEAEKFLKENYK